MLQERHFLLASSADPTKISLTIEGLAVWLIPTIIAVSAYFDVEIAETDLAQLVKAITAVVAGVMIIYGLIRKIVYLFFK